MTITSRMNNPKITRSQEYLHKFFIDISSQSFGEKYNTHIHIPTPKVVQGTNWILSLSTKKGTPPPSVGLYTASEPVRSYERSELAYVSTATVIVH